ncbi:response regulator [Flocculibacter collagenilyticus]|uniref:response regulator n=1 Tax=Flocculibacter collagenilyticus TaxID=2744479 RepID=UPI0018F4C406|nr:response regulator [Flocculibacter collagenilyticus]
MKLSNENSSDLHHSLTKVLVVDDEYFNFEILQSALSKRFSLEYADSGQHCLQKAIVSRPDVILLDVCMPGLDGYDTCRLIKNTPETKAIPVLMVSGLESDEEKDAGFAAGCDDYIVKPFSITELIEKIDGFVGPRKAVSISSDR